MGGPVRGAVPSRHRPLPRRTVQQDPPARRWTRKTPGGARRTRSGQRLPSLSRTPRSLERGALRPGSPAHHARGGAGGQGLVRPFPPRPAARARDQGRHPRTLRPGPQPQTARLPRRPTTSLRRRGLPRPQRRRALLQHRQAMARTGHPLRQARDRLPRRRRPTRNNDLAKTPLETRPTSVRCSRGASSPERARRVLGHPGYRATRWLPTAPCGSVGLAASTSLSSSSRRLASTSSR